MPNRIIKDTIRTSYEIDRLSVMAEITFYRLLTYADDYGLFLADPRILKSELFPLKMFSSSLKTIDSDLTTIDSNSLTGDIASWINEIVQVGIIKLYSANSKPYGYFVSWKAHQRTRNDKPKHPKPENKPTYNTIQDLMEAIGCSLKTIDSNPLTIDSNPQQNASVIQSNPIQSESNPIPFLVPDSGESGNVKSLVVKGKGSELPDIHNQKIKLELLDYETIRKDTDVVLRATVYCYMTLKAQYPDHKTIASATLKTWYEPMRLLIDRDKRPLDEIKAVWEWVREDSFWSQNILSINKFREKYSDLLVRYRSRHKTQRSQTLDDIEDKLEQMYDNN